MNKNNAKDFLPLVQALAQGKEIQMRNCHDQWQDSVELELCYPASRYRVKPEPRHWWAVWHSQAIRPDGVAIWLYPSEDEAHASIGVGYPLEVIHFVEVIK